MADGGRSTTPGLRFALAAALVLAGRADGAPQDNRPFVEDISVTAIEVPVEVLRNGRPVRGLTADDFEILDRGQPQPIVGFEVVDLTVTETVEPPRAEAASPRTPEASAARPASRGRHFLLLFDLDFLEFSDQFRMLRALEGAERMLQSQLHPRDRVAVGLYTGNGGVQILVGFSEDRERAKSALSFVDALLDRDRKRAEGILAELGLTDDGADGGQGPARLMRQLGSAATLALTLTAATPAPTSLASYDDLVGGGRFGAGAESGGDGLVEMLSDSSASALEPALSRVENLSTALGEMAMLLRGVPEPKHLVYFSRGLPNEWIQTTQLRARVQNRLQPLVETMRAAGWRVQAVDTAGVPDPLEATGRDVTAETDPAAAQLVAGYDRFAPWPGGVGFEGQTLFQLANDTGGRLLENYNDFGQATADLIERSAVTYLLVIQPAGLARDGSYHPLTVRLRGDRAGARLLHRPGYYAPKPDAERTALERRLDEAELILGDHQIASLAAAAMAYPEPLTSEVALVPLLVEIEGSALLDGSRGGEARLEIQAYAVAGDGSVRDLFSQQLRLDLEQVGAALGSGPLRYMGSLRMPAGDHRIRLRVHQPETGAEYLTTLPVLLTGSDHPAVLPPMVLHWSDRRLLTLRSEGLRKQAPGGPTAFAYKGFQVLPDLEPELAPGEERRVLVVLFAPPGVPPSLSHRFVTAAGEPAIGGEFEWLQRSAGETDGSTRLIGALRPAGLPPGDYRLEVTFEEPASGSSATASSLFRVGG